MLEPKDHFACGIFALLIYMSLKLAFTPHLLSMFGWILLYWNWKSFQVYCEKRKQGEI